MKKLIKKGKINFCPINIISLFSSENEWLPITMGIEENFVSFANGSCLPRFVEGISVDWVLAFLELYLSNSFQERFSICVFCIVYNR